MTPAPLPEIRIPASLLPADGRFGSGPSKVRLEALGALADTGETYMGTSHRQPTVKGMVRRLREGLAELFALPDGYEVMLGNGGTTAFWDAASFGLIERRSQHLSFGEFGAKFAAVAEAAPHLDDPDVVSSRPGTHPEIAVRTDVDAYAFPHNETSTGVTMAVVRPEGAEGLMLVDATSAAGGLRVDPHEFDAYYFAPQKCFGSDGGLWVALCSPPAVARIERLAGQRWAPASLDLRIALENSRLDQTYNTPALATIFLFVHQLEWINDNGGLEWAASRCDRSAETLYGWAEASEVVTPFVEKPDDRSHTVATIDFDARIDANVVAGVLGANGIVDTEGYRKLGRNQLRIALYPGIDPGDVIAFTACIDHLVERL